MLHSYFSKLKRDNGFTLVELLAVIIIIGILVAVAIPAFANQRKTAIDSSVKSDVHNVALAIETLLVENPEATDISISPSTTDPILTFIPPIYPLLSIAPLSSGLALASGSNSTSMVNVAGKSSPVSISDGVVLAVTPGSSPGTYRVYGWSYSGKNYVDKALVYDSALGGFQTTLVNIPTSGTSAGETTPTGGEGTPAVTPPGDPTGIVITAVKSGSASVYTVKWNAPATGGSIDSYDVSVNAIDAGNSVYDSTSTQTTQTTATLTKTWTTDPVSVQATVVAKNAGGTSTSIISSVIVSAVAQSNKAVFTSVSYNPLASEFTLKWLAPTNAAYAYTYRVASQSHNKVTDKWSGIGSYSVVYASNTRTLTAPTSGLDANTDYIKVYLDGYKSDGSYSGAETTYILKIK